MAKKLIIDWKEYNLIVEKLAIQIHDSGFKPNILIGIMFFKFLNIKSPPFFNKK